MIVRKMIPRICMVFFMAAVTVAAVSPCAAYTAKRFPFGERLPDFSLSLASEDDAGAAYLGVSGNTSFSWQAVQGKLVLIEFFSVFCPKCHENVEMLNRLHKIFQDDKVLGEQVRLMGVAVLGGKSQVELFRKQTGAAYPLFSDPDDTIARKTGMNMVPHLLVVDKTGQVVFDHKGVLKDLDGFLLSLRKILKQAQAVP